MAAGIGSRFGGLKQITPVDAEGHVIMDFSIFDAARAGFGEAVVVIKPENKMDFRHLIGDRISARFPLRYVYQSLDHIPSGFTVPVGRQKPWGTAHAVLCAAETLEGPFAVINADDFYGAGAFASIGKFLSGNTAQNEHAMAGYLLKNTITENGTVARGVCKVDEFGYLVSVTELTQIEKRGGGAAYTGDGGNTYTELPPDSVVSMNFWGFSASIIPALKAGFESFLSGTLQADPLCAEYFLPSVVSEEIASQRAAVRVIPCNESWYGITYRDDMSSVTAAITEMKNSGAYPDRLWS